MSPTLKIVAVAGAALAVSMALPGNGHPSGADLRPVPPAATSSFSPTQYEARQRIKIEATLLAKNAEYGIWQCPTKAVSTQCIAATSTKKAPDADAFRIVKSDDKGTLSADVRLRSSVNGADCYSGNCTVQIFANDNNGTPARTLNIGMVGATKSRVSLLPGSEVLEQSGKVCVKVHLSKKVGVPVSVDVRTFNATEIVVAHNEGHNMATPGADYVAKSEKLVFAANDNSDKCFYIDVLDDTSNEFNEEIGVKLVSAVGANINSYDDSEYVKLFGKEAVAS